MNCSNLFSHLTGSKPLKLMVVLAMLSLNFGCGEQTTQSTSETQIMPTEEKPLAIEGGDRALENLADGDYFYGESPQPDVPSKLYLVFRKTNTSMTGFRYAYQTDNSSCFQGTADTPKTVNNVKAAYLSPDPQGDKIQWKMTDDVPIDLSQLSQISFDKAPEFATRNMQECLAAFEPQ